MLPTYVNPEYAGRLPRTVFRGVCGARHINEELGDAQHGPRVRICQGPRKGAEGRKRKKRKGRKP